MEKYQIIEQSIIKKFRPQIWRMFIRAIDEYKLIEENDKIAICISGGKDSMLLAKCMEELQKHGNVKFDLVYLCMDPGYNTKNVEKIKQNAILLNLHLDFFHSNIFDYVKKIDESPCYLCARMRRGTLYSKAKELGCNKVAYAHHMDDIIETMFLSMFYEGQFYSFAPVTHLDRSGITVIRPLMYVPEANVIGFLHKYHLPLVKNPCPADGETKREYVKQLVRQINLENPGVKKRIFHAICTGRIEGWNINGKQ